VRYLAQRLLVHQGFVTSTRDEADWIVRVDYGTVAGAPQPRIAYFPDVPARPAHEGQSDVVYSTPGLTPSGMNVSTVQEFERYVAITVYDADEFSKNPDTDRFVWMGSVKHDNVDQPDPAKPDELFSLMTAALCDHFGLSAQVKVKLRRYRHTIARLIDPE
jgi:hypothetical protein